MILEFADWVFNVDTDATREFYFEEFDKVLGEIPTEEIEIDTNLGSFAEKTSNHKVR